MIDGDQTRLIDVYITAGCSFNKMCSSLCGNETGVGMAG